VSDSSSASTESILGQDSTLVVFRTIGATREIFVVVDANGVTAFNGHVDLGTGIRTALGQIVAEELDVAIGRVRMVLGSVGTGPDQGPTVASETLQVTAVPLRKAAAQARAALLELAAEHLGVETGQLQVTDGVVGPVGPDNRHVAYSTLLEGKRLHLELDLDVPVKPPSSYRVVGRGVPRGDMPAKATGALTYVQDMRVPGMLHGRVVRPPYGGQDSGAMIGNSLLGVDEASVADIPGLVAVVVVGDFVGVVARREENAQRAADRLRVRWKSGLELGDLSDIPAVLRAQPSTERLLLDRGDTETALANAATRMDRTYVWPWQMHGSIGPSCSVADWRPEGLTLWSGTQNPHNLHADLMVLFDLPPEKIAIHRMETAGCYGRNCADDVGADAALLSRAVGRPVRVQLTREQEHAWEPKGAAQLMEVRGGLDEAGEPAAYDFAVRYPSNRAPTLALILTGKVSNVSAVGDVGDRTAIPPYDYKNAHIVVHDMASIVRAGWMRGVSSMPNSFAHESYIDELAIAAGVDPLEYRLRYLPDPRAADVLKATAERAGWEPHTGPRMRRDADGVLHGTGIAYAVYVHGKFPGTAAAWAAWVAEVAVDPASGTVEIERVTVGQDSGLMINPDGVRHQLHGNVVQSISRVLKEKVTFGSSSVTSLDWGSYPIMTFPELPTTESVLMPRPNEPPVGAGESASVPSAAAIANAIFDATGVRFREVPFTPDRIRAGLAGTSAPAALSGPPRKARGWRAAFAGAVAALAGTAAVALPFRSAIDPVARPDASLYSPGTIERGRQLAAIGNCAVCHTGPDGVAFSGGYRLETPFGVITTPNITPDEKTGIGAWSFTAFARAMREGVHRDGHRLYPAFPYTAFSRVTEADMQALYAYLMSLTPVDAPRVASALRAPFNIRPLLGFWNALFHRPQTMTADSARSAEWNRGAYLVDGLGHCGACHTPRNLLGAERGGLAHLMGGLAEGWTAPALNGVSTGPLPWTETDLYDYLRTGFSRNHGPATGPMAPVVTELSSVPDADLRAMAVYLASLAPAAGPNAPGPNALAAQIEARTAPRVVDGVGARIYSGSCAVCHQPGRGSELFGVRPSLALNSNVHAATPDTLIRTILHGIETPALPDLGPMPAFRNTFNDGQVTALVRYLRGQFAPDAPEWGGVEESVARLRRMPAKGGDGAS
jgi:nicotinate dehydrogenase subunit B